MTSGQHRQDEQAHEGGHHHGDHGHEHGHGAYDPSNLQRADTFYGAVYAQIIGWLDIAPGTAALEAGSGAGGSGVWPQARTEIVANDMSILIVRSCRFIGFPPGRRSS